MSRPREHHSRGRRARARLFALATTAGVACVALTGASSLANAIAPANAEAVPEARATDADDADVARPTPGARRSLLYDRKAAVDKSRARYMRRSGGSRARIGRASGGGGDDDECDEEDEESECGKKKEKEEEKKEEEEEKQEEEEEEEDADAEEEEEE
jgi:RNA polymerase II-associated factor 1